MAANDKCSVENIEKKLVTCNSSQDSVQALSMWIMHNRSHHQRIVDTWLKVLKKSDTKHKLTLFYLCNDVVQHAKRKKALYYLENFKDNLREAVMHVRDADKIKPNIERVLNIWEQRRTYDVKFILELRRILSGDFAGNSSKESSAKSTPMSPISPVPEKVRKKEDKKKKIEEIKPETPEIENEEEEEVVEEMAEFKPTKFIEEVTSLRQTEMEVTLKAKQLTMMRIDATNVDAVKQLKDRSHGADFCKQFEESCIKIEDYVSTLEREIKQRKVVVAHCDQAECFYEEQFKEAKIVATAYKNYGARITNMKKRVDDMKKIIPATPSPVPSPSADAPSPGNTPVLTEMDDNDMVDMELVEEENDGKNKDVKMEIPSYPISTEGLEVGPPARAYTAMVKSIPQPIPSLTNITIGDKENEPVKKEKSLSPEVKHPNEPTNTFQRSNILENRIANMLPNLAKGNSSIGLNMPSMPSKILEGYVDGNKPDVYTPQLKPDVYTPPRKPDVYTPPRKADLYTPSNKVESYTPSPIVEEPEQSDDRASTPVQDEQEEKAPTPVKVSQTQVTKTTSKIKTNPIDFLSQLLTKTSSSSSSSNFLQSLSLLTNTVKTKYDKKEDANDNANSQTDTKPSSPPPAEALTYTGVPAPQPVTQTSAWPDWKNITSPSKPPAPPTSETISPPVLSIGQPPLPQHPPPPLNVPPPQSFPVQPPPPQDFSIPPPVSQSFPRTPVSQSFLAPPPLSQTFNQRPPLPPPSPNAAMNPPAPLSINPVSPTQIPAQRPQFNQGFQYGMSPAQNSGVPSSVAPVATQGVFPPPLPPQSAEPTPPPWQIEKPPITGQMPVSNFNNRIATVPSRRSNWDQENEFKDETDRWDNKGDKINGQGSGYAHPWDQPQNYEEEEEEEDNLPNAPQNIPVPSSRPINTTPKSILRNSRSSSLREVILIDEEEESTGDHFNSVSAHSGPPEVKPSGILKKPPTDIVTPDHVGDVQSEFIAKLKQKSGSVNVPTGPPTSRTLTTVQMDDSYRQDGVSESHGGEPISTIGVLGSGQGRANSVKSDDMEIDNGQDEGDIEVNEENEWVDPNENNEEWQEERQGYISRDFDSHLPGGVDNESILPPIQKSVIPPQHHPHVQPHRVEIPPGIPRFEQHVRYPVSVRPPEPHAIRPPFEERKRPQEPHVIRPHFEEHKRPPEPHVIRPPFEEHKMPPEHHVPRPHYEDYRRPPPGPPVYEHSQFRPPGGYGPPRHFEDQYRGPPPPKRPFYPPPGARMPYYRY